jgi:tetratricopeptide (TPR) repeat protein
LNIARSYNNLGDVCLQRGDWDGALEWFGKGSEIAERGGWVNIGAFTQFNSATAYVEKGDLRRARELLDKSLQTLALIESKSGLGGAHHTYAKLCGAEGDFGGMVEHYKIAIGLYRQAHIPFYTAECIYELGLAHIKGGDKASAMSELHEAASIYRNLNLCDLAEKALAAIK